MQMYPSCMTNSTQRNISDLDYFMGGKLPTLVVGSNANMFVCLFVHLQKALSFNNTIVHRIVQDFVIQMGDVVENDGTGGKNRPY